MAVVAGQDACRIKGRVLAELGDAKKIGGGTSRGPSRRGSANGDGICAEAQCCRIGHIFVITLRQESSRGGVHRPGIGSRFIECGARVHRKRAAGIKHVVVVVTKGGTVEAVAAAAGDDIHRAAGIASVLRVGGARSDAELLHRIIHLEWNRLVAAAGDVIHAVKQKTIGRRAISRDAE